MDAIGNYFVLNHLILITGLTERTLRNYIATGLLQGEKINGMWHFTPEQVEQFVRNPAVRPSILAKQNALVYDFLLRDRKTAPEACVILDLPDFDAKSVAVFFCYRISNGGYQNIRFAFDGVGRLPRVILSGNADEVFRLANEWHDSNITNHD